MITAVIIDDEKQARASLIGDIANYCPEIKIIAEGDSVKSGLEILKMFTPDVVFLDVMMGDGTGFELIEQLKKEKEITFKIIFSSAFDKFAINAIRFSALDYLLKPVNPDELIAAVSKINIRTEENLNLDVLMSNLKQLNKTSKKIVVNTTENLFICNISDIIRCESDGNYTQIYLKDGKSICASKTLKDYEDMLIDFDFIRVHKSHLVNINFIAKFVKADGGYIIMSDKANIPVAQRRKEDIIKIISGI